MDEQKANWTELLEKEYMPRLKEDIEELRRRGLTDEEIYRTIELIGA